MSEILKELFHKAHQKHLEFRRHDTCFHAFAGAMIEAFRERNYRLVGFDTVHARGESTLLLILEQPDGDRVMVRLEPYRTQQTFLRAVGPVAELVFTLHQHVDDPDVVTSAQAALLRQGLGRMLGSFSTRDDLRSGAALSEPGHLRFQVHGAEVVASINLILNLKEYALNSLDFNKDKIGETLDATVYGLEKFLGGMLERHKTAV